MRFIRLLRTLGVRLNRQPWISFPKLHELVRANLREDAMKNQRQADMILHNGRIATLDPNHPDAASLVVKNGRVVGVDDDEDYEREPNTKVIDLNGRRVVPGLNDSHLH